MDKKNTMLLTVIAVATLLVAVVGATFAYFSVSNTNTTTATTITGSTGKIPTITITKSISDLKMYATTYDMKKGETDKSYYATTKSCTNGASCWEEDEQSHKVATIAITGGDTTAKYTCSGKVTVEVTGVTSDNLKSGDMFITLKGLKDSGDTATTSVDLSTLIGNKAEYDVDLAFTGDVSAHDITADVWLVNKHTDSTGEQNYLADQTVTTKIDPTGVKCELQPVQD